MDCWDQAAAQHRSPAVPRYRRPSSPARRHGRHRPPPAAARARRLGIVRDGQIDVAAFDVGIAAAPIPIGRVRLERYGAIIVGDGRIVLPLLQLDIAADRIGIDRVGIEADRRLGVGQGGRIVPDIISAPARAR